MCRIVGFWGFGYKGGYDLEEVILSMRDTLYYGGPDDVGTYVEGEYSLALGHRRLSILDLSHSGHQPIRLKKKGIFDPQVVSRLLEDYLNDRGINHNKLWLLFVFELWRERNL